MTTKPYLMALALTGCVVAASSYVMRQLARREDAQKHKHELSDWEGEGGKPAVVPARAAQPV